MNKKVYRYFFGFFDSQEKWLNNMSAKGWRLVKTTKLSYEFEACYPSEYEYCVEFIGHKSYRKAQEYKQYLEEIGYKTFTKNININYSIGKVRWRPWAEGAGQIATTPGSYNKELLIVERSKNSDSKPFPLHTDYHDLVQYYKSIRNLYLSTLIFILSLLASNSIPNFYPSSIDLSTKVLLLIVSLLLLFPLYRYNVLLHKYKELSKTQER